MATIRIHNNAGSSQDIKGYAARPPGQGTQTNPTVPPGNYVDASRPAPGIYDVFVWGQDNQQYGPQKVTISPTDTLVETTFLI